MASRLMWGIVVLSLIVLVGNGVGVLASVRADNSSYLLGSWSFRGAVTNSPDNSLGQFCLELTNLGINCLSYGPAYVPTGIAFSGQITFNNDGTITEIIQNVVPTPTGFTPFSMYGAWVFDGSVLTFYYYSINRQLQLYIRPVGDGNLYAYFISPDTCAIYAYAGVSCAQVFALANPDVIFTRYA